MAQLFNCIITLLLVLLLVGVFGITPDEERAVLAIYTSLDDNAGKRSLVGYNLSVDICSWTGITCATVSGDRVVSKVKYDTLPTSARLSGTIPAEITLLTNLQEFNINENSFRGTVPPGLYNMRSIKTLRLAVNALTGTLPVSLEGMTSLQKVYFSNNQFSGDLPSKVAGLAGVLTYFNAAGNRLLTGSIPEEFGSLSALTTLLINVCQLSGTIPASLGNLKLLEEFKISSNRLTGTIPPSLGGLDSCTLFQIYSNRLSGSIPETLGNLKKVKEMLLYSNQLTGTIPASIGNAASLELLQAQTPLTGFGLTGTIPLSIGLLSHLKTLELGGNKLNGTIPGTLGDMLSLSTLGLDNNDFKGSIPTRILGLNRTLSILKLQNNQIRGAIPDLKDFKFTELRLINNQFEGEFPSFLSTKPTYTFEYKSNCWTDAAVPDWVKADGYLISSKCTLTNACGDNFCSALTENCTTCPQDCPPCDVNDLVDECGSNIHQCDPLTQCNDLPFGYSCGPCPAGYTGTGISGCFDINECNSNPCDPIMECNNTPGSYECRNCPAGTVQQGNYCQDLNECNGETGLVNGGCDQFRTCHNNNRTGFYCGECTGGRNPIGNASCSDASDIHEKYYTYNTAVAGGIGAIIAIAFFIGVFSVVMLALFWSNFSKHGSFYCAVIVVGVFLSYIAAASVLPEHTDNLCLVFPWFLGISFSLVYGCLFIKTWTLYRVWANATQFKKTAYTPFFILKLLAINLSLEIIYLIVWTSIDPPKVVMVTMVDDTRAPLCESENSAWWAVFLALKGAWMIFGAVLSVLTREVAKEYNESSSIAYATYNNVVLAIIGVPLALALRKVPWGVEIIMVAVTTIAFTFTMCILFFDIWYHSFFPTTDLVGSKMSNRSTSTYSASRASNVQSQNSQKSSHSGGNSSGAAV